jgi:hypothetical protein
VTQLSARWLGAQFYTPQLVGFGWWALALFRRSRAGAGEQF